MTTWPIWLWLVIGILGLSIQIPLLRDSREDLKVLRELSHYRVKLRYDLATAHVRANTLRGAVVILDISVGVFLLLPLAREHIVQASFAVTVVLLFNETVLVVNSWLDLRLRKRIRRGDI